MHVLKSLILAAALAAAGSTASASDARHMYIVALQDAPLIAHARQMIDQPGSAHGASDKTLLRRQLQSADSAAYVRRLDTAREQVLAAGSAALGRDLQPRHVYRHAVNGMALPLTVAEAAHLAKLPGVVGIRPERIEHPLTDAGPQWIGANKLWNAQVPGLPGTKGEGVIVGIIDTGINPSHPSFAASGPDGYAIVNPRGHSYGLCASGQASCNSKLIGIYDFTDEGTKGIDSVGHGSHVSGIAVGNALTDALHGHTVSLPRAVSGVAPHANLIMYKACVAKDSANPDGGCPESALVGAIEQATIDGVDVISYSIGGEGADAYALLNDSTTDAAAMFQARAAGIVVVVAAGNDGPGLHSLDQPGNVPWVIGVANASHNRRFVNSLGNFSGAAAPAAPLVGQGYTAGYGPAQIVYAGNYGNALCGIGDSEGVSPTGASNPFAPGTFHGEIVICDRGTYARVEKGYNVKTAGAGGYILANTASDGEATVTDDHFLPAVHLGYAEGSALRTALNGGSLSGAISGVSAVLDDSYGDILEPSSSRGPYGFSGGILKPDITAPGTNILSADRTGSGLALKTGTSMATPHVAGAIALLVAEHPTWSPAQLESALLGTALAGSVRKEDAVTLGSPLDAGAGRAQPAAAAKAGLYLPLSGNDIRAQDPSHGGNPAKLNRTGLENESCLSQCSFTRTVTDMSGGGTWQATMDVAAPAKVSVSPSQFTLAPGASQVLNIAVDVSDPTLAGTWVSGSIVLHKSTGGQSASDTALTLAAYAAPGAVPAFHELSASAPIADTTLGVSGLVALPRATFTPTSLVPATYKDISLGVDPTPNDLYSKFPGAGKQFFLFPIAQISDFPGTPPPSTQGRVFIVEIAASDAAVTNLYAGIDSNGDSQPNFAEQACASSAHAGTHARCIIDLRGAPAGAKNVWALVDIPQGGAAAIYSVTLAGGVPSVLLPVASQSNNSGGMLTVAGPGHVPAGTSFPLRLKMGSHVNPLVSGTRYFGAIMIDALPLAGFGQIGFVPFALTRAFGGDDIVDPLTLGADGQRNYTLAAGASLRHTFVDIPDNRALNIIVGESGSPNAPAMAFYVARSDFPPASVAAEVAAAPPATAAVAQWTLGGSVSEKATIVNVGPGRWYIVATNTGASDNVFSLIAFDNTGNSGAAVPPVPGAFFNPQRSGHGIFVSQAAGQQVLYWYTYREDAAPIWYAAQAAAPANGAAAWSAPLFRVNWDGSADNSYTILGDAILTPLDADDVEFSWHLYGAAGNERFTRLGPATRCVDLNGTQTDLSGQWFSPAESGYGMDALAIPSTQFDVFYLYDALGQPLWVAGSASPFAASSTMQLNQISGFCPSCAWVSTTPQIVGTLNVSYASGTQGSFAADLTLLPPLSGNWNTNQPMTRLTGSPTCP